jgi:phage/plasmid primase-like uncharacterized protein
MIDLNIAKPQKSERYKAPEVPNDPAASLSHKMEEYGLDSGSLIGDGKLHRFKSNGRSNQSAWYVFHLNLQGVSGAAFGDWATGLKETWCSHDTHKLSDDDAKQYYASMKEASRLRKEQEALNQNEASRKAVKKLDNTKDVTYHPYLEKKGVSAPSGIKQDGDLLLIPMTDTDGKIWSAQEIKGDGTKNFPFGSKILGNSFTIQGSETIAICEGIATGISIHEATGATVIIAFNRANMKPVAEAVRAKCPGSQILICADNDQFTPGNPGITDGKSAAQAVNGQLCFPTFTDLGDRPTDFNDLAMREGIEMVKNQIHTPGQKAPFPPFQADKSKVKGRIVKALPPVEYIFNYEDQGLIPKGVVGVLCAAGGTGKTFWLLSLAYAGAAGGNFGPISAPKPIKTLVLVAEDPQDELDRRLWNIGKGQFPEDLHAGSIYGEVGPLMRLDGNVPVRADGYYWLEQTIQNHPGMELLILDPKSRLFGLNENDNDHCTQWIQSLEYLAKQYGLTILFSHHTSKEEGGKISQNMGRGGSAIVDGCRWQAGLVRMDGKTADHFGIDTPRDYIVFDAPKSNYAADLPGQIYFRRGNQGVLEFVDPAKVRLRSVADALLAMLRSDPKSYTRRQLERGDQGKDLVDELKEHIPSFKRTTDTKKAIDMLLESGALYEAENDGAGTGRKGLSLFVK